MQQEEGLRFDPLASIYTSCQNFLALFEHNKVFLSRQNAEVEKQNTSCKDEVKGSLIQTEWSHFFIYVNVVFS
jgi:hypothetical protein